MGAGRRGAVEIGLRQNNPGKADSGKAKAQSANHPWKTKRLAPSSHVSLSNLAFAKIPETEKS